VRWEDLPIDAHIIFLSHEWIGWNHPDPHGIQLKTFLRVMQRLKCGKIPQVETNHFHTLVYKTNHVVQAEEWKEILSTSYVWIDWASMPQPSVSFPNTSIDAKDSIRAEFDNAVKSISAYVISSTFLLCRWSVTMLENIALSLSLSLSLFVSIDLRSTHTHAHTTTTTTAGT